ncbi:MAG: hypothetical protein ACYDHX_17050 [Methanothrix sp.]
MLPDSTSYRAPARGHTAHPGAPGPRAGARAGGPWGERPRVRKRRTRMRSEPGRTGTGSVLRVCQDKQDNANWNSG